jgi:hypothetical protein
LDKYWKRLQPQSNWYAFSPKLGWWRYPNTILSTAVLTQNARWTIIPNMNIAIMVCIYGNLKNQANKTAQTMVTDTSNKAIPNTRYFLNPSVEPASPNNLLYLQRGLDPTRNSEWFPCRRDSPETFPNRVVGRMDI